MQKNWQIQVEIFELPKCTAISEDNHILIISRWNIKIKATVIKGELNKHRKYLLTQLRGICELNSHTASQILCYNI